MDLILLGNPIPIIKISKFTYDVCGYILKKIKELNLNKQTFKR